MLVSNRHGSSNSYRYGFQGQEKDDEIKGEGNSLNYTFRMHDPRVGRFFAIDPDYRKFPMWSPYSFASNDPIRYIDINGEGPGDTVIIFSGAIISLGFQGTTGSVKDIRDEAKKFTPNTRLYATLYNQDRKHIIKSVVNYIKQRILQNPDATISLVGYSYGGVIATDVAKALKSEKIEVKLLYTIDSEDGPRTGPDRTIPSNVKLNINKFQKNGGLDLRGGENIAEDKNKTVVKNEEQTNTKSLESEEMDHFNIDDYNVKDVIKELKKAQSTPTNEPKK